MVFDAIVIAIGLVQIAIALFAPSQLRAYPGGDAAKRALGLVAGTIIVAVGIVMVAT